MKRTRPEGEEAIARLCSGDNSALETLFDCYASVVFALLLRMMRDPTVAEDLVQETFLRVWQQASTYSREKGRVSSWVLGIAHHLAVDELRRIARSNEVCDGPEDLGTLFSIPDGKAQTQEAATEDFRREAIAAELAKLPSSQRMVIELAYFDGLTQIEIAKLTGMPLGTIKTRARLGLLRLRSNLRAQGLGIDSL